MIMTDAYDNHERKKELKELSMEIIGPLSVHISNALIDLALEQDMRKVKVCGVGVEKGRAKMNESQEKNDDDEFYVVAYKLFKDEQNAINEAIQCPDCLSLVVKMKVDNILAPNAAKAWVVYDPINTIPSIRLKNE